MLETQESSARDAVGEICAHLKRLETKIDSMDQKLEKRINAMECSFQDQEAIQKIRDGMLHQLFRDTCKTGMATNGYEHLTKMIEATKNIDEKFAKALEIQEHSNSKLALLSESYKAAESAKLTWTVQQEKAISKTFDVGPAKLYEIMSGKRSKEKHDDDRGIGETVVILCTPATLKSCPGLIGTRVDISEIDNGRGQLAPYRVAGCECWLSDADLAPTVFFEKQSMFGKGFHLKLVGMQVHRVVDGEERQWQDDDMEQILSVNKFPEIIEQRITCYLERFREVLATVTLSEQSALMTSMGGDTIAELELSKVTTLKSIRFAVMAASSKINVKLITGSGKVLGLDLDHVVVQPAMDLDTINQ